jgi:4-amino-4-deoxy-L-arabinose transferase-like glycosyltransferase
MVANPELETGQHEDETSWNGWWLLLGLGLLLYVPVLGLRDLWYPDEPDIAEVAKAMFLSGDWIAPRRMGVIWVDYPPMIYWAGSLASRLLGGMSEFALRLPNALAAIGLVILTTFTGSRWFNPRAGLWAGFALLTFGEFTRQAVSYRPDVLFSLAIGAGLIVYARGTGERARWLPRVMAFALLGLAMLAKGPLGLLLPGLVLTLWHAGRREWRRILELAPLSLISLAVYLSWFVACAKAMGADNILWELYAQNFARFASGSRGHGQPIYYYVLGIWAYLWPWSVLLPFAITWIVRTRRWRDRNVQLALWWFGTFFVFLSIAVTKRGVYLMPAHAAAALLLGGWLAAVGREDATDPDAPDPRPVRWYAAGLTVSLVLLLLSVGVAVVAMEQIIERGEFDVLHAEVARALCAPLAAMCVIIAAALTWIGLAWRRGELRSVLLRIGISQAVASFALLAWVLPTANPLKTYAPQSRWVREQIGAETRFGLANPHRDLAFRKMGAFGYYSGAHVEVLRSRERIREFLEEYPASLVLVEQRAAEELLAGEIDWYTQDRETLQRGSLHYVVVRAP